MRRVATITLAVILLMGLAGCITQADYDGVLSELNYLKNEIAKADNISREEYNKVADELASLKSKIDEATNMFRPRVVELPSCMAVASGWKTNFNDVFDFMFKWVDSGKVSLLYPNDFLCLSNEGPTSWLWLVLLDDGNVDTKGFELIDFPGGLFVTAIAIDDDQADMSKTVNEIEEWVNGQEGFELDYRSGRYQMTRRITSDATWDTVTKALGYEQIELFIPIKTV